VRGFFSGLEGILVAGRVILGSTGYYSCDVVMKFAVGDT